MVGSGWEVVVSEEASHGLCDLVDPFVLFFDVRGRAVMGEWLLGWLATDWALAS